MSIKTFEMFTNQDFSNVEQISIEEFNDWDSRKKRMGLNIYTSKEQPIEIYRNVERIVISNVGACYSSFEVNEGLPTGNLDSETGLPDSQNDTQKGTLGVMLFSPESYPGKQIIVKVRISEDDLDFGVILSDQNTKFQTLRGFPYGRELVSGAECYLCYGYDGLDSLFRKLSQDNYFIKPAKTPTPYKNKPLLTDEDFSSRGLDNQNRASFYKDYGTVLKDILKNTGEYPEDMEGSEYESNRKKALNLLDNWVNNS